MYTVYKEKEFEDIAIFSAFTKVPYNFKVSTAIYINKNANTST